MFDRYTRVRLPIYAYQHPLGSYVPWRLLKRVLRPLNLVHRALKPPPGPLAVRSTAPYSHCTCQGPLCSTHAKLTRLTRVRLARVSLPWLAFVRQGQGNYLKRALAPFCPATRVRGLGRCARA
nr:MAG TPA: hypothetical protein [Caudoviricetes sp.]